MSLDGGFLHNLISELAKKAVGCRVDKVFQPTREEIVLLLRSPGFSGRLIISARNNGSRLHFTNSAPENPAKAPMFCMLLRKYIGGARVVGISQYGLERVAKIQFESHNELGDTINPSIIVELITGSPNIIFTDTDSIILDSVRRSDMEKNTRMVQPGAKYVLPESRNKLNVLNTEIEKLYNTALQFSERRVWEAILSVADGVSPLIACEFAMQCNPDLDTKLSAISEKKLKWTFEKLQNAVNNGVPYIIYKPNGVAFDFSYVPIRQYGAGYSSRQCATYSELLDEFYSNRDSAERIRQQSQDILKLLTNLSSRIARKISARKGDLKKCEDREKYRIYGELLKSNMYMVARGDSEVLVTNYYSENSEEVRIPLNVALSPADNAQKYFKEYKKLCVAEKTLQDLISDSEQELKYIESVFDVLSRASSAQDLMLIRDELAEGGYIRRPVSTKVKKRVSKPLSFVSTDGFQIYVGKNNLQNDELTLHFADKRDLWFHTKNIHGSHTILCLGTKEPTEQSIIEAAMLAAYYSKAAAGSGVPVDYTAVKNVKKPAGARPGMVIYTTNQTVYVTPDAKLCDKLRG